MTNLPTPIGRQREVLYLAATGHTAVLGTAGSGKTTLAMLRSAYLSDAGTGHAGLTLLVTFNKALVTYLKYLRPNTFQNVVIENYHTFARGYLSYRGKMGYNEILDPSEREHLIASAIKTVAQNQTDPLFRRPISTFSEEIRWILSHGITSYEEYDNIERVGATSRIIKGLQRKLMYQVLEEYIRLRTSSGRRYDWDDLAHYAKCELLADTTARKYKHIVIDEGQDFSPEMIRSLSAAIPSDGSLTFFGDVAQQIYGQRMSWRSAGLRVRKVWEFEENYRNTREIARLGLAISRMPYFKSVADMVEPRTPTAGGDLPSLVPCANSEAEIQLVMQLAIRNATNQRVAILFKNRKQEGLIKPLLPAGSIRLHGDMAVWNDEPGIRYGTYHSAKGLEFDMVILPLMTQGNLPDSKNVEALGIDDALTHDGRLLYVAITRARTRLVLTYTGQTTELLPSEAGLYRRITVE